MKILLSLLSMFLLVPGLTFAEAPVRTSDESMHGQLFFAPDDRGEMKGWLSFHWNNGRFFPKLSVSLPGRERYHCFLDRKGIPSGALNFGHIANVAPSANHGSIHINPSSEGEVRCDGGVESISINCVSNGEFSTRETSSFEQSFKNRTITGRSRSATESADCSAQWVIVDRKSGERQRFDATGKGELYYSKDFCRSDGGKGMECKGPKGHLEEMPKS